MKHPSVRVRAFFCVRACACAPMRACAVSEIILTSDILNACKLYFQQQIRECGYCIVITSENHASFRRSLSPALKLGQRPVKRNFLTCHISLCQITIMHCENLWKKLWDGMLLLRKIRIIAAYFRLITTHFGNTTHLF